MNKLQTLTTIKPRGGFQYAEAFCVILVLGLTLSIVATCGTCLENGLKEQVECESFGENSVTDSQNGCAGDVSFGYDSDNGVAQNNPANVCPQSNLFCFPSTLPGYLSEESDAKSSSIDVSKLQSDFALLVGIDQRGNNLSWSSKSVSFQLAGGRTLSCSVRHQYFFNGMPNHHTRGCKQNDKSLCNIPLHDSTKQDFKSKENDETVKSVFQDSSMLHVEISPPLLDWGQKYLYFPSSAFVTVRNTHEDHILNIYESYSTSSQFFPCSSSEISLVPGEVVSICFVFLPTLLGFSSAKIILQTNYGGFLIHAKGLAVESPYGIEPLVGLDVPPNGKFMKNLSVSNPFSEAISVEELIAWISVSSGNTSSLTEASCGIKEIEESNDFRLLRVSEWLDLRSTEIDLPIIAMRPHRNWEVGPGKTETIMELDFSYHPEGKIFGGFFMQLSSSSRKNADTIMVPLEAEWSGISASDEFLNPASVSLQVLTPCDTESVGIALSVRNDAPYLLSVLKVSEVGGNLKHFNIKYIEGLILFPGTTTQVAVASYTSMPIENAGPFPETPEITKNCKLLILTNDSRSPQTEIHCGDVVHICSRHNLDSSIGYRQQSEEADNYDMTRRNMESTIWSPSHIKALDKAEADELVLRNWKSQATASDISVLDDHVVAFPVVQVGSHFSEWITVKNPSQQPVVMQLIMNSAEIIDECRELDKFLIPSSSSSLLGNKSANLTRYGFSLAENAVTEAFVHPYGRASLGPVFFQPSNCCGWKSSALIRNNLSGVEWLSLQGFGGSFSMLLLEESKPVQTLDFKLKLLAPLNLSSPDMLYQMVDKTDACSQSSSKLLHAKNTGDLPLKVRRIEISGTECGLNGFLVHTCKGFALEPGETKKLIISYQADFSAPMLHRDLQFTLNTGILVIPLKGSVSMHMFNLCRRSMFWMRIKKSILAVILAAFVLFVIVWGILPHLMAFGSRGYLFEDGRSSSTTIGHEGKYSHVPGSQKKGSKCAVTSKMNGGLKSKGEEEILPLASVSGYSDEHFNSQEQDLTLPNPNSVLGTREQYKYFSDTREEIFSPLSVESKPMALDSSNVSEALQAGNLTIKIGNEKRRRRRKKRNSGAGLAAAFEVSSSQSGNSTPSSPMSPLMSSTPTRQWHLSSDGVQSFRARNLFAQVADLQFEKKAESRPLSKANILEPEISAKCGRDNWHSPTHKKPVEPREIPGKAVVLPSATFPVVDRPAPQLMCHSPVLASTSKIAPHAKAPGSKLNDQNAAKTEEKDGIEEKFTYDIWGNHLFGPPLTSQSTDISAKQPHATENNSDSFFVRDLQTLMTNSQKKSVSCPDQVG